MSVILYERTMSHGVVVRIRRLTPDGSDAVRAVLEVDRRAGTSRGTGDGHPPPLMAVEGASEPEVVASLLPFAEEDSALARLLAQQGVK